MAANRVDPVGVFWTASELAAWRLLLFLSFFLVDLVLLPEACNL